MNPASIFVFENNFASFQCDGRVLTKDELFLLRREPLSYPSNEKLLVDNSKDIKEKIKQILKQQILH